MRDSRDGAARIRDLRNDDIEVMSYDRLVERYRECAAWHLSRRARILTDLTESD